MIGWKRIRHWRGRPRAHRVCWGQG